jgi:hypothetical protein
MAGLLFEFLGRFRTGAGTLLAVKDFMIVVPLPLKEQLLSWLSKVSALPASYKKPAFLVDGLLVTKHTHGNCIKIKKKFNFLWLARNSK